MRDIGSQEGERGAAELNVTSGQPTSVESQRGSLTSTLAGFAAETSFDALSVSEVGRATRLIAEAVGCALGAQALKQGRFYIEHVQAQGGQPESTVIGTKTKATAAMVAWANAGLINTLDFDDTLFGHPGSTVVGPAFAVAEARHASGRQLLTAVAVGYEISLRVSEAIRASVGRWRQVTASSTAQTFGAAAATAKLLGLDRQATARAYGLAASMAPVPAIRKFGTQDGGGIAWTKNQYSAAAIAGVMGAQLAESGAIGPEAILDGDTGFWIMAGSDRFDPSILVEGLGDGWRLQRVAFKPYPCCRFFHPSLDALRRVLAAETLSPDSIAAIRVSSVSHLRTFLNRRPSTAYDAEFSLPHALALTALGVPPGLDWFDESYVNDQRMHALMDSVEVDVSEDAERNFMAHRPYSTEVELVTTDGRRRRQVTTVPLGHPNNPMSEDMLNRKFVHLAGSVTGPEAAEEALMRFRRLQYIDDVAELLPLLTRGETDSERNADSHA